MCPNHGKNIRNSNIILNHSYIAYCKIWAGLLVFQQKRSTRLKPRLYHDLMHQPGVIIFRMCHVTPTSMHHPTTITSASPPVSSILTISLNYGFHKRHCTQRMVWLNESTNWLTNIQSDRLHNRLKTSQAFCQFCCRVYNIFVSLSSILPP